MLFIQLTSESHKVHFGSQLHTLLQRHLHRKAVFKTSWESSHVTLNNTVQHLTREETSSTHSYSCSLHKHSTLLLRYWITPFEMMCRDFKGGQSDLTKSPILSLYDHDHACTVTWNNVVLPNIALESRCFGSEKISNMQGWERCFVFFNQYQASLHLLHLEDIFLMFCRVGPLGPH